MYILLLISAIIISSYIGYKFGRRAERWEQNHPTKKETPVSKDGVKEFLDNLNQN